MAQFLRCLSSPTGGTIHDGAFLNAYDLLPITTACGETNMINTTFLCGFNRDLCLRRDSTDNPSSSLGMHKLEIDRNGRAHVDDQLKQRILNG